jgi:aromatic-amino-acid transaminase
MFTHLDTYPGDPILTLNEQFSTDPRTQKINLGIGVYLDESRRLPKMNVVLRAEVSQLQIPGAHPYLPMEGLDRYRTQAKLLVFGGESGSTSLEQIATVQTLGGSGALSVGADFLQTWFPDARVWVSDPTWDNHWGIFRGAGFSVGAYSYYSPATKGVDFGAMLAALTAMAAGDIVVLHACCHNPTGANLTQAQWQALAVVFKERALVPFFDSAYQGFGDGVDEDPVAIRHFASAGIPLLVASSFSKNFALYGERCGALHVLCPDAEQADKVLGQLKASVRRTYSSPPANGGRIVAAILEDVGLHAQWRGELDVMRKRMKTMRAALYDALKRRRPDGDFEYLMKQQGMFSFTGLSVAQVRTLREEHGVYLIESGRICIAALTTETVEPVADAIAAVTR